MSDLAEFLLARIAEDEDVLTRSEPFPHYSHGYDDVGTYSGTCPACRQMIWGSRERGVAECEAKRRIVAGHRHMPPRVKFTTNPDEQELNNRCSAGCDGDLDDVYWVKLPHAHPRWPCPTLRLLALPYADHPAYREEWRP